MAREMLRN